MEGIGNYTYSRHVGAGNFAQVKLARHRQTNLEVAIKIIDKAQLDPKTLSKLYREVRIMKQLNHPNIVRLYEVLESPNHLYLVMDFASGGELYDYLVVHGRIKEKEARRKFLQLFAAVKYCHDKHIIHRDLKAENLLLDSDHHIKVADFGFGNNYDPRNVLDTFCGSPPYAAPELFQGIAYVGPEVDVWSMGVILYMMTTSTLPFDGKTFTEMKQLVCRGHYTVPFYISSKLQRLFAKMINVNPASRASLDLLLDDPWLNDEGSIRDVVMPPHPTALGLRMAVEIDESVVQIMVQKYKLDRHEILHSVKQEAYDGIYAMYRMHLRDSAKRPQPIVVPPASEAGSDASPSVTPPMDIDEGHVEQIMTPRPARPAHHAHRESSGSAAPSPSLPPIALNPVVSVVTPVTSPNLVPQVVLPAGSTGNAAVAPPRSPVPPRSPGPQRPSQATVTAGAPSPVPVNGAAAPGSPVAGKKRRQRSHTIGARAAVPSANVPPPPPPLLMASAEAPPAIHTERRTSNDPPIGSPNISPTSPTSSSTNTNGAAPPTPVVSPGRRQPIQSRRRTVVSAADEKSAEEAEAEKDRLLRRVSAVPLEIPVNHYSSAGITTVGAPGATPAAASPEAVMFQRIPALRMRRSETPKMRTLKTRQPAGSDTEEAASPPMSPVHREDSAASTTSKPQASTPRVSVETASMSGSPGPSPHGSPVQSPKSAMSTSMSPAKPRTVRLPLSTRNTTTKTPDLIIERIFIVAHVLKLECKQMSSFIIQVLKPRVVHFEVEVCYVPILRLHSLRIARLSGPADTYKTIAELFLRELKL